MSFAVFLRNSDGSAWEGRMYYDWKSLRMSNYEIKLFDTSEKDIDKIYASYGTCSALKIKHKDFLTTENIDDVYRFLYGYSFKEFMQTVKSESAFYDETWKYSPKEWKTENVETMDWDMFCLSYYVFLSSANDFDSQMWKVLEFILKELKNNPTFLSSLLLASDRSYDKDSCNDFWEAIYIGLEAQAMGLLHETSCYKSFQVLSVIIDLYSENKYQNLKNNCCILYDEIAKKRIDEACSKTYTIDELLDFNIELLFFYEEYFKLNYNRDTQKYVFNQVFTLLHTKADKVVISGKNLAGDKIYENALKFAQTDEDRYIISIKRDDISKEVSKMKKKQNNARLKDKASDIIGQVLAYAFVISLLAFVIFGVLTLLGVFKTVSKVIFIVSLCVLIPTAIVAGIGAIQEKMQK